MKVQGLKPSALELQLILDILCLDAKTSTTITFDINLDWQLLLTLAIRHRVAHQVFAYLNQFPYTTSIPIFTQMSDFCNKNKIQLLATTGETVRSAKEFNSCQIESAFIKGMILNVHI